MVRIHNGPPLRSKSPKSGLITPALQSTDHSPRQNPQSYADTITHHSLRQLIDGFILSYKLDGKSPLTIDSHQQKLSRFLDYLEKHPYEAITTTVVRNFLGYVRETYNLEPSTVQRYLITLKAFWRWAIEEGFAVDNPTARIRLAKPQQKVVKGLSPDQLQVLLSALKDMGFEDARNKAIVLILLDCGLRVSELANLRLEDVDMNRGILTVMGKGSKQRLARMGLKTQKALWRYMMLRESPVSWLWLNQCGGRLTANGIQQMIRKLGKKLGISLHPHLLRHTFAISFLRNGANTFECQYALGHSSLEMTRRYCQALNFDDVFKRHQSASPVDNAFRK
ncbi:tyrosine-type recombinase/integrase [Chloroflexota bacterium]